MKKYIKFRFLLFAALLMILSCDQNQTEVQGIISTDDYPIATFVVNGTKVDETGGAIVTVDITFDKPIGRGVNFSGTQVGGNAVEGEDYVIHSTIVEAYSLTAQMVIEIFEDDEAEGEETLDIQVDRPSLASKYLINPVSDLPLISITIDNYVGNSLDLSFDWETDVPFNGSIFSACDHIDQDVYVSSADGFDINDPWASTIWGAAETGNCPEEISMSLDDYPDGNYVAWSFLWANDFFGLDTDTDVPITTRPTRAGVFSQQVDQDESQWTNSDDAGWVEGAEKYGIMLYIKVENGVFTVINYDGETEAMGKTTNSDKTNTRTPVNSTRMKVEKREGLVK